MAGINFTNEEEYSRPLKTKQMSKTPIEKIEHLIHLHVCEQEGISSGQPTPKDWMKAVDEAHEAVTELKPSCRDIEIKNHLGGWYTSKRKGNQMVLGKRYCSEDECQKNCSSGEEPALILPQISFDDDKYKPDPNIGRAFDKLVDKHGIIPTTFEANSKEDQYGTPITLEELKNHYDYNKLTEHEYADLLIAWKKSDFFIKRIDDIISELDQEDVAGHLWWNKFKDFLLT